MVSLRVANHRFGFLVRFQIVWPFGHHVRECIDSTIFIGKFSCESNQIDLRRTDERNDFLQGRVDCIRSASVEALAWAKAMCQGEGADVALESDKEDDDADGSNRKVKFKIYSVKSSIDSSRSPHTH